MTTAGRGFAAVPGQTRRERLPSRAKLFEDALHLDFLRRKGHTVRRQDTAASAAAAPATSAQAGSARWRLRVE